ncbi:hypothetical protein [Pengzhenrongella sicca]|uniref:hypothetical protein n=1 Tax=Pengzhenrongella sicca TaxID=2819238 RepID=UPI001D0CC184|nr:hypothetical protein [Pengzhenrongella sicca]
MPAASDPAPAERVPAPSPSAASPLTSVCPPAAIWSTAPWSECTPPRSVALAWESPSCPSPARTFVTTPLEDGEDGDGAAARGVGQHRGAQEGGEPGRDEPEGEPARPLGRRPVRDEAERAPERGAR